MSKLSKIYYGSFMSGGNRFYKATRRAGIPLKDAVLFYNNQTITQIFRPRPTSIDRSVPRQPVLRTSPFDKIYCDTMFFSSKTEPVKFALICYVDGFTKYGWLYYIPISGVKDEKTSVSVADGVKSLNQYLAHIKDEFKAKPSTIFSDDGSEFSSAFVAECKARDIDHKYGIAGDILKNPIVENFNRSVRMMIEKFRATYNAKNISSSMVNKIVEAYNNLETKGLGGLSPVEATDNVKDVIQFHKNRSSSVSKYKPSIGSNAWVRVSIKKIADPFAKTIRPNWSTKLYQVDKWDSRKQRFLVGGKYYMPNELQPVNKDMLDKYDTFSSIKDISKIAKPVKEYAVEAPARSDKDAEIARISALPPKEFLKLAIEAGYVSKKDPTKTSLTTGTRLARAEKIYNRLHPKK